MCWRNVCNFSLVTKKCEKLVKMALFFFFFKWAPFWNLISKKKQLLGANGADVGFQWVTDGLFSLDFSFPKIGPHGLDEGYP